MGSGTSGSGPRSRAGPECGRDYFCRHVGQIAWVILEAWRAPLEATVGAHHAQALIRRSVLIVVRDCTRRHLAALMPELVVAKSHVLT